MEEMHAKLKESASFVAKLAHQVESLKQDNAYLKQAL